MSKLKEFFQDIFIEKKVKNVNVDDDNLLIIHRQILKKKPMLKSAFTYFYMQMIEEGHNDNNELELEIGSGAGFFKDINENVKSSDIRESINFDIKVDAQDMPFDNSSLRNIYAINVFHHLPDPVLFLNECRRVLKMDGAIILIEPHNGFLSSFIHKRLHKNEYFDSSEKDWNNTKINGPLSGANQAMSHIVFVRDIHIFEKLFQSKLVISKKIYMHNWLRYLFSGGVNFKQTLPNFMIPIFAFIEKILKPFAKHLSLHQMIVIKKIL